MIHSSLRANALPALPACRPLFPVILVLLFAGGCAFQAPPPAQPTSPTAECAALFQALDLEIAHAGAMDHGPVRIAGFHWLRADRFLASFAPDPARTELFAAWVERLGQLDSTARTLELVNYSDGVAGPGAAGLEADLARCRTLLQEQLLLDPGLGAQLAAAVQVPDDYVTAWRIAGLYPLTAPFVSLGIARWHEEARRTFDTPLGELPIAGNLQRWRVAYPEAESGYIPRYDALGIPVLDDSALKILFRRHAPVWEVDVVDHNDRIGTPVFAERASVSTDSATQYHYTSYTRFGDRILLQLNYVIWFPARTGTDIYAGNVDGLTWRVTLGPDGEPWMYDSIHNCGCYHMYFPTAHLHLREDLPAAGFEPPLVPQSAPEPPLVVRIDSGRHYIQRVYQDTAAGAAGARTADLAEADYDQLRSLPAGSGYRSFFGPHGLVQGSERGERFLLWPMGVRSPGAMRQRGHQPVAFVGRRHFDDARLIETLFQEGVK
jgi:hypothetical protein